MIRGLYTSASGMIMESIRTDITANNVANTDTTGFKKEVAILKASPEMDIYRFNDTREISNKGPFLAPYIGKLGTGTVVDEVYTSFEQGQIVDTGDKYNMALMGKGFFTVADDNGNVFYTRDGNFVRNGNGYIMTKDGHFLQGEGGHIILTPDEEMTINEKGEIWIDEDYFDTLAIVEFPDANTLEKVKDNLYRETEITERPFPADCSVIQSSVERSNVSTVKEMLNMITALRAYEANQKCIQTHDETLGKAVNDVGRNI